MRAEGWSLRRIGEKLGVDPMTVHHDLAGVEDSTPGLPAVVTGADGKQYPAKQAGQVVNLSRWRGAGAGLPRRK